MERLTVRALKGADVVTLRLTVEDHRIAESEPSPDDEKPSHFLVHAPLNAHTHVGDAFLTGKVPKGSLAEIVAPPDGFKHRALRAAPPNDVVAAAKRALEAYHRAGARRILDFREGGADGVALLRAAMKSSRPRPSVTILGRPDAEDAGGRSALEVSDGFGLPGLRAPQGVPLKALAEGAHAARKIVALHLSEDEREPVEEALALAPDLLVHLCSATVADVKAASEAGVRIAVCPISNARFGLKPPIPRLIQNGARWAFGTDNAMFGGRSVFAEAAAARAAFPEANDEALVGALEAAGWEKSWGIEALEDPRRFLLPLDRAGTISWDQPARLLLAQGPNTQAPVP